MLFKSQSYYSSCLNRRFLALIFSLGCAQGFVAPPASATIRVSPVNSSGSELSNSSSDGNSFYYVAGPYTDDASAPPLYFRDFTDSKIPSVVNVTLGQSTAPAPVNRSELVYFSLASDNRTITAPLGGYVVIFATAQGTNGEKPIPIAFVGDGAGNGGFCPSASGCLSQNLNSNEGFTYSFSYQYTPGNAVMLGFYPIDVCKNYTKFYGGSARGCDQAAPGTVNLNQAGSANAMQLRFYVSTLANTGAGGGSVALEAMLTNPAPPDKSSSVSSLIFESFLVAPTLNCSGVSSLVDVYQPGDSEIFMNTDRFPGMLLNGVAPVTQVIVVGNDGASPVISSGITSGNRIAQRVVIGTDQSVGGFENTTNGTDHQHDVAFMVRDAAGIVVTGQGNCHLTGVQTSQIQGFLQKSSCFIATAAYRSNDAPPVMMLREFRDAVLMKSELGRAFVRWYYHWSPEAAEWLMGHPMFRYPILLALVPVEIFAWSWLNPGWFGAALLILLALGMVGLFRGSRRALE